MRRCEMKRCVGLLCLAAVLAVILPARAVLAAEAYEQFFGRFEGTAIVEGGSELSKRDLRVEIRPSDKGFLIEWVALIQKPDGRTKRSAYKIPFRATRRAGIYGSAMKNDMFGHPVPLNPLKGEPYVWARVVGNVLTTYFMIITETGGYEMQVYTRELVNGNMELVYTRNRNGKLLRTVVGTLSRVE